jgi:signal transduction histidine kinase/CheY-like chemotaxis protein
MLTTTQHTNSENVICGLIIFNNQGQVVMVDPTAKKLLNLNNEIVISTPILSELLQVPLNLTPLPFVKTLDFSVNGEVRCYRLDLLPFDKNNGRILQIKDITSIQRIKSELSNAKKQLAKAEEKAKLAELVKASFFNTINHEIRTPLGAIVGMSSLLRDTPLNSEQKEIIDTISSNSDSLLKIIKNILEFSRIENGELEFDDQPFDLRDTIDISLKPFREAAQVKEIQFQYNISEETPNIFFGDPIRIQQILVNILDNAVKYTHHGSINISITTKSFDEDFVELFFAIQDTGIGISHADQLDLFKPFHQTEDYLTRKHGGTGLGLAISKKLCELMNGRIWVQSEPDLGSTFYFTLTLKPSSHAPIRYLQPQAPSLRGKRILIVAQNAEHRRSLSRETRSAGMSPYVAGSLSEVTYWLKRASYDFAILDSRLLVENTEDLIAHILKLAPQVPVLLMGKPEITQSYAEDSRITALIHVPIKTSNLYDIFINVLSIRKIGKENNNTQMFESNDKLNEMGKRHPLTLLMVEDNPINQKIATRLLGRLGYQLDIAPNGLEGLRAINQKLYDVIFMDIQMPIMDGLEATRQIRGNIEKSKQPRIIAVTAHAMEGDREEYIEAGMDDYISKPIKIDALITALHKCKPQVY